MKHWLKIVAIFLVCFALSAGVATVSLAVLLGYVVRCAMSLGCGGITMTPSQKSAAFGLLVPFVVFALGAFAARWPLGKTTLPRPLRVLFLLAFALFPLAGYASLPFVLRGFDKVREIRAAPARRRLEEFERELKAAPVAVLVKRARVVAESETDSIIELAAEVKNVPPSLSYYELNIYDVNLGGRGAVDLGDPEGEYESSLKVRNAGGTWEFFGYHKGRRLTSGADTFTTRVRYVKPSDYPAHAPHEVRFRLGVWARDDKVYERDCIFFYDWVEIPRAAFERTP